MLTDDEKAYVLALVRHYIIHDPRSRTVVGSHVQTRGPRKRSRIAWDGTAIPTTFTYVEAYCRWNAGIKRKLYTLALACKQDTLTPPPP